MQKRSGCSGKSKASAWPGLAHFLCRENLLTAAPRLYNYHHHYHHHHDHYHHYHHHHCHDDYHHHYLCGRSGKDRKGQSPGECLHPTGQQKRRRLCVQKTEHACLGTQQENRREDLPESRGGQNCKEGVSTAPDVPERPVRWGWCASRIGENILRHGGLEQIAVG